MHWQHLTLVASAISLAACGAPVAPAVDAELEPVPDDEGRIARYLLDDDPIDGVDAVVGPRAACSRCPTLVTGRTGGGLEFAGAGQLVHARSPAALDAATELSAAVWVRLDATTDEPSCVVSKPRGGTMNSWQLCISRVRELLACMEPPQGGQPSDSCRNSAVGAIALGTWQHIALTYDGAMMRVYIDAAEVIAFPQRLVDEQGPIVIGADVDDGASGYYLDGTIDDVRVWIRALSAAEIAAEVTR